MKTRLLALAVLAAGCDPSVFGDLGDSAWVVSSGAPSGIGGTGFGAGLVAPALVEPPDGFAVVGLAQSPAAIGTIEADLTGSIDGLGGPVTLGGEVLSILPAGSAFAAAPVPVAGVAGGLIAVGLPNLEINGVRGAVSLHDAAKIDQVRAGFSNPSSDGYGRELVLLDPAGDGSAVDLIVASNTELFLYADVGGVTDENSATPVSCSLASSAILALVAADLDATDGDEVLAVIDDGGAQNEIVVLNSATIAAAGNGDCFEAGVREPLARFGGDFSAAPDFGFASAVGDSDGNGDNDFVALSSPTTNDVFLWDEIDLDDPPDSLEALDPGPGAADFGFSLAAGDIDGDGNDDLVVGDPGGTVDGEAAGAVTVFLAADESNSIVLHDAQPDGGQRFGRSVVVAPFFEAGSLVRGALVVGADEEIFSYFRTSASPTDRPDLREPSPSE